MLGGAAGAYRDTVLMNAGAGLVVAGKATTLSDGIAAAAQAIDSGRALAVLDKLIEISALFDRLPHYFCDCYQSCPQHGCVPIETRLLR